MARRPAWHVVSVVACGMWLAASSGAQSTVGFTRAQVDQGRSLYARHCAECHGAQLTSGNASALSGRDFQARWGAPSRSLHDLFYVLRTSMPFGAGGTLATDEYVAVLAFILERNGHAAGDRALVSDREALSRMRLVSATPAAAAAPGIRYPNPASMVGPKGLTPTATGPAHEALRGAASNGADWLTVTRDYSGSRYSPLKQITTSNVNRLRVACSFQVGQPSSFQTAPVVHGGTMYITAGYATMAIDAATCRPKWRHDWTGAIPSLANRGVAVKDGRVVRGTGDGYLFALDAANGSLLWARRIADVSKGEMISMPPLVYDDLVFIAPAVSEYAIRGWIAAYRLQDGERVWRFNIVPEPGEPGSETWKQDSSIPIGGGAVWTPMSLDAERELLFVPAANPAPDFPVALRGGTNLYTNSVIALHLRTGKLAWYDQMVPLDDHDWDLTQVSPLYRANVRGRTRNVVATVGKDGVLRTVDRDSKERLFAVPVTTIHNADAPVTKEGTRTCPGVFGGVQWNGPTHHPGAGVLVVPAVDWCATFMLDDDVRFVPGQNYLGGRVTVDTAQAGWLTAVDASSGSIRWRYKSRRPMVAAVTSTAGGLVFAAELTGDLMALDVATGEVKFRHFLGGQAGGGIVTYEVGGRQHVAVASGTVSAFWRDRFPGSPTITVFALDGAR